MTMKKVEFAYIDNHLKRKETFRRRSKGLLKKVEEISILCGVTASAIIYNSDNSTRKMWPPENGSVETVISNPKIFEEPKRMLDQNSFIHKRIDKESKKLEKLEKKNRELELTEMMYQCLDGDITKFPRNITDLKDLEEFIDRRLNVINHKREVLRDKSSSAGEATSSVGMSRQQFVSTNNVENMQYNHNHHEQNQQQQNHHLHEHNQQQQLNHHHHHEHNQQQLNYHHHHEQNQQQQYHHHQHNQQQQNHHHQHNQQQQNHGYLQHNNVENMNYNHRHEQNHHHHEQQLNYHHHEQNQQQQVPDNSSTAFGQYLPLTSPNLPNDMWSFLDIP